MSVEGLKNVTAGHQTPAGGGVFSDIVSYWNEERKLLRG